MQGERKTLLTPTYAFHHAEHSHVVAHRWDLAVRAAWKQGPDIPLSPLWHAWLWR